MPDIATAPTATNAQTRAAGTKLLGFYLGAGNVKVDVLIDMANIATLDGSANLVVPTANIGIGTTSPNKKLHVALNAYNVGPVVYVQGAGTATSGAFCSADWTNTARWSFGRENVTTGDFIICYNEVIRLRLKTSTSGLSPGADNANPLGEASFRWSTVYAGTGTINTSDERAKREIGAIPDEWLDAWGDVEWCRYKFVDGQRWHVGLVAQQVHAAFAAHELDAFAIGLCCYDAWDEQREAVTELVEIEAEDGSTTTESRETGETRVALEAGDRWGLRYEECQAIEAAWQRRELMRLRAALKTLGAAL